MSYCKSFKIKQDTQFPSFTPKEYRVYSKEFMKRKLAPKEPRVSVTTPSFRVFSHLKEPGFSAGLFLCKMRGVFSRAENKKAIPLKETAADKLG